MSASAKRSRTWRSAAPYDPLERVSQATGYDIVRLRTDYYGTCPECREADFVRGEGGAYSAEDFDDTDNWHRSLGRRIERKE